MGGHHLDLGAGEVPLGDAVLFVQQHQGVQLDGLLDVGILHSVGADEHVQLFGLDALAELAVVLLGTQMGQQIGDAEHGVILVSPTAKDTLEPSARVNTPWMASGMVPHWYLRMPP